MFSTMYFCNSGWQYKMQISLWSIPRPFSFVNCWNEMIYLDSRLAFPLEWVAPQYDISVEWPSMQLFMQIPFLFFLSHESNCLYEWGPLASTQWDGFFFRLFNSTVSRSFVPCIRLANITGDSIYSHSACHI